MNLDPKDVLGVTINRIVGSQPPADCYKFSAQLILNVGFNKLLSLGKGTIGYGGQEKDKKLFPAVAWQHTTFVDTDELQNLVAKNKSNE